VDTTTQRKLRDDYDLKINMSDPHDFQYFIVLYDSLFQTKEKLQWAIQALQDAGGIL
jgi:hypothetical protein